MRVKFNPHSGQLPHLPRHLHAPVKVEVPGPVTVKLEGEVKTEKERPVVVKPEPEPEHAAESSSPVRLEAAVLRIRGWGKGVGGLPVCLTRLKSNLVIKYTINRQKC